MVKLVRLKSGEELIGEVKTENSESITLEKTMFLYPTQSGEIGLTRYMPYAKIEDGLLINKSDTYFVVELDKALENHYKELTGGASSIIGAEEKKIVT